MSVSYNVAVLGGGSFGTAMANIVAENGHTTRLWLRDAKVAEAINTQHRNPNYMPDLALHEAIKASTDLVTSIEGADLVIVAVPSAAFRSVIARAAVLMNSDQVVISTTKGIDANGFKMMSEILREELPTQKLGVLSGPNLAKEISKHYLTASVIASPLPGVRAMIQTVLKRDYFRVYAGTDMYGVELAGALKNIYAIISGLGVSLGIGENTKAMIVSRSLAEMSRFAVCLGANPMTFMGLAGVGDLMVTCTSPLSRNFRVGYALGQGKSLQQAEQELGEVAEGINTLKLVKEKAEELEVYMPLVVGLYEVLFNQVSVDQVVNALMTGDQSSDVEFILPRTY